MRDCVVSWALFLHGFLSQCVTKAEDGSPQIDFNRFHFTEPVLDSRCPSKFALSFFAVFKFFNKMFYVRSKDVRRHLEHFGVSAFALTLKMLSFISGEAVLTTVCTLQIHLILSLNTNKNGEKFVCVWNWVTKFRSCFNPMILVIFERNKRMSSFKARRMVAINPPAACVGSVRRAQ